MKVAHIITVSPFAGYKLEKGENEFEASYVQIVKKEDGIVVSQVSKEFEH